MIEADEGCEFDILVGELRKGLIDEVPVFLIELLDGFGEGIGDGFFVGAGRF